MGKCGVPKWRWMPGRPYASAAPPLRGGRASMPGRLYLKVPRFLSRQWGGGHAKEV
jgi:hypothetical protein